MYVNRLEFSFAGAHPPENLSDMVWSYLSALSKHGQILDDYWPIYLENGRCVSITMTPETDSLDARYHNEYAKNDLAKLAENGISFSSQVVSEALDGGQVCRCRDSSGYVLYATYLSVPGQPVQCLDCFGPVPLYKLPTPPNSGEHYELLQWEADYISCDSLQMHCNVLEKTTTRQMSDLKSALSKKGRKIGDALGQLTGKPFYYYLYNATDTTSERERHCPSCGGAWLLSEPLHHHFDFRCDRCRLLSNIAFFSR